MRFPAIPMRVPFLAGLLALGTASCISLPEPQEILDRYYTRLQARQAEKPRERLTVSEPALAKAVREHNRTVKSREELLLAAQERYAVQRTDYLPQLRLVSGAGLAAGPEKTGYGGLVLEQKLPGGFVLAPGVTRDDDQLTTYSLAVSIPIPFLTRGAAEDAHTRLSQLKELSRAAADYGQAFRGKFREAASSYYEAATLQTIINNQKEQLQFLRQVGEFYAQKQQKPPAQYHSDVAAAESRLSSRRAQLADAKARLNRSLGLPLEQRLSITLPDIKPVPGDEPALARQAVTSDPELIDAAYQLAVDDAAIAAAKEGWLPKLTLAGGNTVDRDHKKDWDVGIGLDFSLFDSGRRHHQGRQAEHSKRATEMRLEQRMLDLQYDIHRAYSALSDISERLPLLRTSVERAQEAVEDGIQDFKDGKAAYGVLVPLLESLRTAKDDMAGTLRSHAENRTLLELLTGAYDQP
jgi:outer membrane protein TolC